MPSLFDPLQVGAVSLANRIVMAPLTRNRSVGLLPGPLAVEYYRQRASAGLIISEGAQITPEGQGYLDTPGIYSPEQTAAWKLVTDAVHEAGGKIAVQLWHVGRISHSEFQPNGAKPQSSTDRQANSKTFTKAGFVDVAEPRALTVDELPGIVQTYVHAAKSAMAAGFDAVEVHGANGYLLDQFLRDSVNDRSDAYGGSIENRARLLLEVMKAIAEAIGADRTGLRLSPVTPVNDAGQDSDAQALFNYVVEQLAPLKLAFLHVIEGQTGGPRDIAPFDYNALRERFKGVYIANNGYTREMAIDAVATGHADAVAFGRSFISNPDLVRRLKLNAPLQKAHSATMYGGGAEGYTDYPALAD
ncbi:MAG: alkene reductase [Mitsuaria chitosanitabida]|uniref:alkene reductase n=1 Tax=Roseateles chitosanitabidus TaxID=65048 RepID=UPI001B0FB36F|nr:alkene reductase [Roseateles chitosanitabidus]MBO9688010.1 alkene reductase [Roseateles chitosanitabidus]